MLKEIHEQPEALAETINDRTTRGDGVDLDDPGVFDESVLAGVQRIVIVGCGTAYHAGDVYKRQGCTLRLMRWRATRHARRRGKVNR